MNDLRQTLFAGFWEEPGFKPCVTLDGAGIPGLLDRLHAPAAPRWECLYRGELAPGLAEVAPYLVEVPRQGAFLDWLASGWGLDWGVYALVPEAMELSAVRRHLRKLNLVYGPGGEPMLFRWYDPRVLRTVAPTCSAAQLRELFGPVRRFVFEGESAGQGMAFDLAGSGLATTRFSWA